MDFEFLFYLLLMTVDFINFWTTCFIFGYMSNAFLKTMSNINEINCQNVHVMMGVTRRDVLV
jgi:hypothetical protein